MGQDPWRLRFKVVLVAQASRNDFYSLKTSNHQLTNTCNDHVSNSLQGIEGTTGCMLAIDILKWPGMNQAIIFSLILTVILTGLIFVYGKRRPIGTPVSWGEAMIGSVYAFFVMFIGYGVLPHQWLVHVQNELGWRSDKPFLGPGSIFKSQAKGGSFPFDINYLQIGDIIVTGLYGVILGVQIYTWMWWQSAEPKNQTQLSNQRTVVHW